MRRFMDNVLYTEEKIDALSFQDNSNSHLYVYLWICGITKYGFGIAAQDYTTVNQ